MALPHITVCVCTFRRTDLLRRLFTELEKQETAGAFTFSVTVVDNDAAGSARATVEECARESGRETRYSVEPLQGIARARNRALANSRGEYIAFIDDDEYPTPRWLALLLAACRGREVSGVLGPVLPHFPTPRNRHWLRMMMKGRATLPPNSQCQGKRPPCHTVPFLSQLRAISV